MHRLILVLTLCMLCLTGLLHAQDADTIQSNATGNIEVYARGCDPPPYKKGLAVTLNSMAFLDNDSLYGWIIPYAMKDYPTREEFFMIKDSVGWMITDLLNWYKRKYAGENPQGGRINEYNDYMIAEGITDSMGYYVFEDVPVGIYQVRCGIWPVNPPHSDPETRDTTIDLSDVDWDTMPAGSMPEQRIQMMEESCENGVTNFVRVAPDSTSIVEVFMTRTFDDMPSVIPYNWEEEFK